MADRRQLYVMPDHYAFPVWSQRGALHVRPGSLPISEGLRDALQAWCDRWGRALEDSWYVMPDDFPLDEWVHEGRTLTDRLRAEVGHVADVVFFADDEAAEPAGEQTT